MTHNRAHRASRSPRTPQASQSRIPGNRPGSGIETGHPSAPSGPPDTGTADGDGRRLRDTGAADSRRLRDITQRLARDSELPEEQTHGLVRRALSLIIATALEEGRCAVPGIGVFRRHDSPERPGRNPRTGEPHPVPARTIVKFRQTQPIQRPPLPGEPDEGGTTD